MCRREARGITEWRAVVRCSVRAVLRLEHVSPHASFDTMPLGADTTGR